MMRIVFMGTPDFSVPCLDALKRAGHEILAVFTQPDKPRNRGHKMMMPPVKEYAVDNSIPVFQPMSLRKGDDAEKSLETLRELSPDCIVVVAYGQFLPKTILDLPKYGCINVHASLLPRYRGAAPIQRVIMDGETETGVTTMYMGEGIDTGDMIFTEKVKIEERTTYSELHDALSSIGAKLIVETLDALEKGTAVRIRQTDDNTCYAKMLTKDDCHIDFTQPARTVYNRIRGLSSSPCAYTMLGDKRLKVFFAEMGDETKEMAAGTVIDTEKFTVACGSGSVRLTDIQPEGGKRMSVDEFLRGRKLEEGTVLS